MWPNTNESDQILQFDQIRPNPTKYDQIRHNPTKSDQIRHNLTVGFGPIWSDLVGVASGRGPKIDTIETPFAHLPMPHEVELLESEELWDILRHVQALAIFSEHKHKPPESFLLEGVEDVFLGLLVVVVGVDRSASLPFFHFLKHMFHFDVRVRQPEQ